MSNKGCLRGRIALITGSTSGIGLAIAERLAEDGAKVIVSSRIQENVDCAVKKLTGKGYDVCGIACHIADPEHRKRVIELVGKIGGLDIFVQCAGVNPFIGPILDIPEEKWDKTIGVNLKATWQLTCDLARFLKKSKNGRIIYNSSMSAYMPVWNLGAYPVSKAALISLTRMVALQLGHFNITVNCIVPGLIDTPFSKAICEDSDISEKWLSLVCIKRLGQPADVAGITAFLASDEASYITGESICISGGISSRL